MGSLLFLLPLLACKASSLGVDVPRGGPDALSAEDVARDLWMLTDAALGDRSPGAPGAAEGALRVQRRLEEMHLLPAFGDDYRQPGGRVVCGQKDGRSDKAALIAAIDAGVGAGQSAAPVAALISLAKAFDVPAPPADTLLFCVFAAEGGAEAYAAQPAFPLADTSAITLIGPIGGEALRSGPGPRLGGRDTVLFSTGPDPAHGTEADRMEALDHRRIVAQTAAIYEAVLGP